MVKVKKCSPARGQRRKIFVSLELTGDLELVQSQNTGRFYATTKHCFVSSTLDLETARGCIGQTLPGKIIRVVCQPYEYALPESGQLVILGYRYEYQPEEAPVEMLLDHAVSQYESIED